MNMLSRIKLVLGEIKSSRSLIRISVREINRTRSRAKLTLAECNQKQPLLVGSLTYGSIVGLAEFAQQALQFKIFPAVRNQQAEDFDFPAVGRYVLMGGAALAPLLYYWYKWLDETFPGKSGGTVFKKVFLDMTVLAVPLYTMFYAILNLLEGSTVEYTLQEIRAKLLPTLIISMIFWIPAQIINFRFLPPQTRVLYIAVCTFIEVNILCVLKKLDVNYLKIN